MVICRFNTVLIIFAYEYSGNKLIIQDIHYVSVSLILFLKKKYCIFHRFHVVHFSENFAAGAL